MSGGQWGEDDDLFDDEEGGGGKKKGTGKEEGSKDKEGGKGWGEDDDLELSDEDEPTPQRRSSKVRKIGSDQCCAINELYYFHLSILLTSLILLLWISSTELPNYIHHVIQMDTSAEFNHVPTPGVAPPVTWYVQTKPYILILDGFYVLIVDFILLEES